MHHKPSWPGVTLCLAVCIASLAGAAAAQISSGFDNEGVLTSAACGRLNTITADIVALDQVYFWNRLGAVEPQGQIYALRRDVVSTGPSITLQPGQVSLRSNKRPRPLVLRVNEGQCLHIKFQNLLTNSPSNSQDKQPSTRTASVHVTGMQLVGNISGDGSWVGKNPNSMVPPGGTAEYTLYAEKEGTYLLHSNGALVGGEGEGGTISTGLFGAVNVQPRSSEWYRSQVTEQEMSWAVRPRLQAIAGAPTPPAVDYDANYPNGHRFAGTPIFRMLHNNQIVHSDLTAIITGPGRGNFSDNQYPKVAVYHNRLEPFREFTIIFHDEVGAVQAFPAFTDPQMEHTLHSVRDAFAINYGTGGIGAEILANRLGVGPMYDCVTCKYEEFFLSAWAVGDPAMVVDVPANTTNLSGQLITGPKATKAFYPDDPSNVYHSYLNDRVKFRNLLAGTDDHHIFHLHAHQWLHTPDSDHSTYLDSQAIGQGTTFTYEITYEGSGNRNKTVGDSIFHCHFYPHFAQGMWAMWRTHDVLELGTPLDGNGRPVSGSRAYPDAEILAGTPIPAVVPLPNQPMPPMPTANVSIVGGQVQVTGNGNPGFPFFVPGVAGQRPPRPPMDMFVDGGQIYDGGLPRHVVIDGDSTEVHNRFDFTKTVHRARAVEIPEDGTKLEVAAMNAHSVRQHTTCLPEGGCGQKFIYNGLPALPGAPFADPCQDDNGNATGRLRRYKAANIQTDVTFNKVGWHFEQQRFISLWGDIKAFLYDDKPPEPFFFRANTNDCVEFLHTNLVPDYYELDDFQVRTPTDILGQHIHLVKFDVTSSDGGANGWNYEDGNIAPKDVRHLIDVINVDGGIIGTNGQRRNLTAVPHPALGSGPNGEWVGAQTSVQRWFVDDVLNLQGKDRTLRTVFTHDHFGPSTHQQSGLYAGLVVEKEHSLWRDPVSGTLMGSRFDGGPTSWQADIIEYDPDLCGFNPGLLGNGIGGEGAVRPDGEGGLLVDSFTAPNLPNELIRPCSVRSYREFLMEFGDFQQAYEKGRGYGGPDPLGAINAPECPDHLSPPCPEAVSAADPGTMLVNYRNEPIALRIKENNSPSQANGQKGDLSWAYSSLVSRDIPALNSQPSFYDPLTPNVLPRDPYTPLLQAYEGDEVQIRVLVGAHEEEHNFSVSGVKWLFEPSDVNSGYRNSQMMGISEHYEFEIPKLPVTGGSSTDYLYRAGASVDDIWNGIWGLMRVYKASRPEIQTLPTNEVLETFISPGAVTSFDQVCPQGADKRTFNIVAVTAAQSMRNNTLIYNARQGAAGRGPLHDPTAIVFIRKEDLNAQGSIRNDRLEEPLILRARAGECIVVNLENRLPLSLSEPGGANKLPKIVRNFNADDVRPSTSVGLHPQLVAYDARTSDGMNVGINPTQTVAPGQTRTYVWYAGDVRLQANGSFTYTPIEFGATGLISSDPIKHSNKGAVGALVIEPPGSKWTEDWIAEPASWPTPESEVLRKTYASATVGNEESAESFREFVLVEHSDINLRYWEGDPVPNLGVAENSAESGHKGYNYRTEPVWFRLGYPPEQDPAITNDRTDMDTAFANSTVGGDPVTPVFNAQRGDEVRIRMVHPGGHGQNSNFGLHGHIWRELPYVNASRSLGANPVCEWKGSQFGHGPSNHFDILLEHGAGGINKVSGDYMYRDYAGWMLAHGLWGILRVH